MSESTPPLAGDLAEALDLASDADGRAADLFRQFLACGTYSRPLAMSLIDVAQGGCGDSWEVRCLATLMLQEHLLSLPAGNLAEFRVVLGRLGLAVARDGRMPGRVLKEGYSRRDLPGFVREFRRRLARPGGDPVSRQLAYHPGGRPRVLPPVAPGVQASAGPRDVSAGRRRRAAATVRHADGRDAGRHDR